MEHMLSPSDLNFASVRAKTGRAYHVNPCKYFLIFPLNIFLF